MRRPILCVFIALLLIWGTISGLALFNPAIAERFNNAVTYFGMATVTSAASDMLRKNYNAEVTKNRKVGESSVIKDTELEKSRTRIDEINKKNSKLELDVKERNSLLKRHELASSTFP